MYNCPFCEFTTKYKSVLERHKNKKIPCILNKFKDKNILELITYDELRDYCPKTLKKGYIKEDDKYRCIYCNCVKNNQPCVKEHVTKYCEVLRKRFIENNLKTI